MSFRFVDASQRQAAVAARINCADAAVGNVGSAAVPYQSPRIGQTQLNTGLGGIAASNDLL